MLGAPLQPQTWAATGYLLLSMVFGVAWFTLIVTLLVTSASLVLVWVGLPLLALSLLCLRGIARFERAWARAALGADIPDPYRLAVAGLALCVVAAWVSRGLGAGHAAIARGLLGPSPQQLARRVEALQASRARTVDAAEAERRRIERDLHDGAQQRLVALAMDLGIAKERLAGGADPEAVSALVATRPSAPWRSCATWPAASTRRCWPTAAWTRPSRRWRPAPRSRWR